MAETARREIQLQQAIFDLSGLTPEEVRLLRAKAPARDPLVLGEEVARLLDTGTAERSGA